MALKASILRSILPIVGSWIYHQLLYLTVNTHNYYTPTQPSLHLYSSSRLIYLGTRTPHFCLDNVTHCGHIPLHGSPTGSHRFPLRNTVHSSFIRIGLTATVYSACKNCSATPSLSNTCTPLPPYALPPTAPYHTHFPIYLDMTHLFGWVETAVHTYDT